MILGKQNEFDIGIHFGLNSEFPNFRWSPLLSQENVPSLCDNDGYCFRSVEELHEHCNIADLQREVYSQLEYLERVKLNFTHMSRHMYALERLRSDMRLSVWGLFREIAEKYKIAIRSTDKIEAEWLTRQGVSVVNQVYTETHDIAAEDKECAYVGLIEDLKPGISELIVHCGYDTKKLRDVTASAPRRAKDFELMMSHRLKELIREEGIILINWRQVPELLRLTYAKGEKEFIC